MNELSSYFQKIKTRLSNEWVLHRNLVVKFFRKFYPQQHQLTSITSSDRYPELFQEAKNASLEKEVQKVSILSFGCSTGEECFSLRNYFLKSKILGVDINKSNLATANKKNIYSNIKFRYSTDENIREGGPYQIIFCLSVLCRWEDTKNLDNCESVYPFEKFQSTVKMLSNVLAPGGHLIIYNSNFRFEDSTVFFEEGYEIVSTPSVTDSGFVTKFDRKNNRVREVHRHCIYRKPKKNNSSTVIRDNDFLNQ